jgi:hypothetical protein
VGYGCWVSNSACNEVLWTVVPLLSSPYKVQRRLLWRAQHWLESKCCCGEITSVWKLFDCPVWISLCSMSWVLVSSDPLQQNCFSKTLISWEGVFFPFKSWGLQNKILFACCCMTGLLVSITVGWEIASMKNYSNDSDKSFTVAFISACSVNQIFQRVCLI